MQARHWVSWDVMSKEKIPLGCVHTKIFRQLPQTMVRTHVVYGGPEVAGGRGEGRLLGLGVCTGGPPWFTTSCFQLVNTHAHAQTNSVRL